MKLAQVILHGDATALQAAQKAVKIALGVVQNDYQLSYEWDECGYTDEVGGHHDSGCGWMPDGHYCGECSQLSCKDCGVWQHKLKTQALKNGGETG